MGLGTAAGVLGACPRSARGRGNVSLPRLCCCCCHAQSHSLCSLENRHCHHALTEPISGSLRLEKTSGDLTITLEWSNDLCTIHPMGVYAL